MNYRLAHFSDFHFAAEDDDFARGCALLDDAIENGADHLVVTGDIADAAQIEVVSGLVAHLDRQGWASAVRLTIVPGNHDIFPLSWNSVPSFGRPTSRYEQFLDATRASRRGTRRLVKGDDFPFAKELAPDVVLVGLDSTRNGQYNPLCWAEGELPAAHRRAVTKFFGAQSGAAHRIIAMHHHPWPEDFEHGWIEQNFTEPEPAVVEAWLRESGATLTLCGHVHEKSSIESRTLARRCRVLRSGTAGGVDDLDDEGNKRRIYHLIDLTPSGRLSVVRREFNDGRKAPKKTRRPRRA